MKPRHWTYSRLSDYEKCPALYEARYMGRWPGFKPKPHPALDRGNKIHGLMEERANGGKQLAGALAKYDDYVEELLGTYTYREVEVPLGFNVGWQPVAWKADDLWLRMKMDFFGMLKYKAKVVDWKTGGMYGTNADQVRLYAGATFERFKSVKIVEVELVYLDHKQAISETLTRTDWKPKKAEFTERAHTMLSADKFPIKPGGHCSYCDYNQAKGGPCSAGIVDRSGLQTGSERARVVVPQAAPLRGRYTGSGVDAPAPALKPARRAKATKG